MRRPGIATALAGAAIAATGLALAAPAPASPATLKRAVSNIVFAPVDFALSPATGAWGLYTGMRDQDDSLGVRIAYPVPGLAWNIATQAGASCLRGLAGLLELLPGIGLFFFDADLDPIYAPVERAEAWVDYDTPVLSVKFGINYIAPQSF